MSGAHEKESTASSRGKYWIPIASVFLLAEAAAFVLLGVRLYKLLPTTYLLIYAGIAAALCGLSVLWVLRASKSLPSRITFMILTLLLLLLSLFGIHVLGRLQSTLDRMTSDSSKVSTEMVILVLKDEDAFTIDDIHDFLLGYVSGEERFIEHVQEELKKGEIGEAQYIAFENLFPMIRALYEKKINAILLDKAYLDLLADVEGFETFSDDVREIYYTELISYIQIREKEPTASGDDVSSNDGQTGSSYLNKEYPNGFVIYVSGIDRYGSVVSTSRSDVNILIAVNTKTKQIQIVNTPRDYYVPLPFSNGYPDKLTHAGIYGVDASMETLEMLYQIPVKYYLRMNFTGFESIIDTLGGIDVYSAYDFKTFTEGVNHLNGAQALIFARSRYDFADGDIQRGKNQMEVVKATFQKVLSRDILLNYSEILDCMAGTFQTNMTSDEIYALVKMQLADMASWDVNTYTVTGSGSYGETYSMPGYELWVMLPDYAQVAKARDLMVGVLEGTTT